MCQPTFYLKNRIEKRETVFILFFSRSIYSGQALFLDNSLVFMFCVCVSWFVLFPCAWGSCGETATIPRHFSERWSWLLYVNVSEGSFRYQYHQHQYRSCMLHRQKVALAFFSWEARHVLCFWRYYRVKNVTTTVVARPV